MKIENRIKLGMLLRALDEVENFIHLVDKRDFKLTTISNSIVLYVDHESELYKALLGCLQAEKARLLREIEKM